MSSNASRVTEGTRTPDPQNHNLIPPSCNSHDPKELDREANIAYTNACTGTRSNSQTEDPRLFELAKSWTILDEPTRKAILAIVRDATERASVPESEVRKSQP